MEANRDQRNLLSRDRTTFLERSLQGISGNPEQHLDLEEEGFHSAVSLGIDKKRTISFYRRQAHVTRKGNWSQKPLIPGDKKCRDSSLLKF